MLADVPFGAIRLRLPIFAGCEASFPGMCGFFSRGMFLNLSAATCAMAVSRAHFSRLALIFTNKAPMSPEYLYVPNGQSDQKDQASVEEAAHGQGIRLLHLRKCSIKFFVFPVALP